MDPRPWADSSLVRSHKYLAVALLKSSAMARRYWYGISATRRIRTDNFQRERPRRRPPGRTSGLSTRSASRRTRSLSPERLVTQFEMITSTVLSGSAMFSISPFRNSTFSTPAARWLSRASASIFVGHGESVGPCREDRRGGLTGAHRSHRPNRSRAPSHQVSTLPARSDCRIRAKPRLRRQASRPSRRPGKHST